MPTRPEMTPMTRPSTRAPKVGRVGMGGFSVAVQGVARQRDCVIFGCQCWTGGGDILEG
jgi:hypothetical protein